MAYQVIPVVDFGEVKAALDACSDEGAIHRYRAKRLRVVEVIHKVCLQCVIVLENSYILSLGMTAQRRYRRELIELLTSRPKRVCDGEQRK